MLLQNLTCDKAPSSRLGNLGQLRMDRDVWTKCEYWNIVTHHNPYQGTLTILFQYLGEKEKSVSLKTSESWIIAKLVPFA